MAPRIRDIEKNYPRKRFVAMLRRFADAIEAGKPVVVTVGANKVKVPADAVFGIEHDSTAKKGELEFEIEWSNAPAKKEPAKKAAAAKPAAKKPAAKKAPAKRAKAAPAPEPAPADAPEPKP
ncbi:MAG: amphi-Trp domain-containing protein [Candidatus Sumerlaeia bacterium]|nr:amphi-Trp domain-containing protein [Candidatus Sumerlaeia bacterium]